MTRQGAARALAANRDRGDPKEGYITQFGGDPRLVSNRATPTDPQRTVVDYCSQYNIARALYSYQSGKKSGFTARAFPASVKLQEATLQYLTGNSP